MVFLRHASRHVHASVANYVKAGLAELNWDDPNLTPLGAPAIRFRTTSPVVSGKLDAAVGPGLVAISLGNEFEPDPQELGGGLHMQEYPFFVDCFMGTEGECTALACDVRDMFLGRFEFSKRSIDVVDQVLSTPVPGWKLEFDDVSRVTPDHTYSFHWQVVRVTAQAFYTEVVW